MSILHGTHTINVYVNGVDRTGYLVADSLVLREALDGDLPTAELTLEDTSNALTVGAWNEVRVDLDGVPVWGGYAVRPIPVEAAGGTHRIWKIRAEGYARRFRHTDEVTGTWVGATPQTILIDAANAAGLGSEFDVTTYVPTSPTVDVFAVRDMVFSDVLDRLCMVLGATWRVDGSKRVHIEVTSTATATAPYGVTTVALADWSTTFPANSGVTMDYGDVVINRVVVRGGWQNVGPVGEVFTGDGVTTKFQLSRQPIQSVIYVEVDGDLQSFGTMWVHSFSQYSALIDYSDGVVYFGTAPASGATVRVAYRYMSRVEYTATDAASYANLGFYVTHTVHDPTVTTEDKAKELANALLAEFADVPTRITFTVERPWFVPGHVVNLNFPLFGISGNYLVREVTTRFKRGGVISQQVTVGGRAVRLGEVMRGVLAGYGGSVAADPYGPAGLVPTLTGTTDEQNVSGQILAIDPRTSFTSPT